MLTWIKAHRRDHWRSPIQPCPKHSQLWAKTRLLSTLPSWSLITSKTGDGNSLSGPQCQRWTALAGKIFIPYSQFQFSLFQHDSAASSPAVSPPSHGLLSWKPTLKQPWSCSLSCVSCGFPSFPTSIIPVSWTQKGSSIQVVLAGSEQTGWFLSYPGSPDHTVPGAADLYFAVAALFQICYLSPPDAACIIMRSIYIRTY